MKFDFQFFYNFLKIDGTIVLFDNLAYKGKDILFYLTEVKGEKSVVVDAKDLKGKKGKDFLINAMKEAETEHKLFF